MFISKHFIQQQQNNNLNLEDFLIIFDTFCKLNQSTFFSIAQPMPDQQMASPTGYINSGYAPNSQVNQTRYTQSQFNQQPQFNQPQFNQQQFAPQPLWSPQPQFNPSQQFNQESPPKY